MDLTQAATISAKSHNIQQRFLSLITLFEETRLFIHPHLSSSAIIYCFERLSLWAGNTGAMGNPLTSLSLDQQLFQSADVREQINRQLDEIEEATDDLTKKIHNQSRNNDKTVDQDRTSGIGLIDKSNENSIDEAKIILLIIHECINSLFRLGMLVKKPSPHDRFKQAFTDYDRTLTDSIDIDYIEQRYSKLANSLLSTRLGRAVAKRRRFIIYCRDQRSPQGIAETAIDDFMATGRLQSKAVSFYPLLYSSSNSEDEEWENSSFTSVSTTAHHLSGPTLSRMANLPAALQTFECSICFY
ncbi:hypothetical protein GGI43DRAFT_100046 [Trichoderma evansii]